METTLAQKNKPAAEITPENYAYLQTQVYKESGIVLDETKLYSSSRASCPSLRRMSSEA